MFDDGRLGRMLESLERANIRAATRCAACERVGRGRREYRPGVMLCQACWPRDESVQPQAHISISRNAG
jgi:hypothetical protein